MEQDAPNNADTGAAPPPEMPSTVQHTREPSSTSLLEAPAPSPPPQPPPPPELASQQILPSTTPKPQSSFGPSLPERASKPGGFKPLGSGRDPRNPSNSGGRTQVLGIRPLPQIKRHSGSGGSSLGGPSTGAAQQDQRPAMQQPQATSTAATWHLPPAAQGQAQQEVGAAAGGGSGLFTQASNSWQQAAVPPHPYEHPDQKYNGPEDDVLEEAESDADSEGTEDMEPSPLDAAHQMLRPVFRPQPAFKPRKQPEGGARPPTYPSAGAPAGNGNPQASPAELPKRLQVICNDNRGEFLVDRQVIVCLCEQCKKRARQLGMPELELSPTDFERHSGSYTSKKWKYTVKVLEPGKSGLTPTMNMGAWLDKYCPTMVKGRGKSLTYSAIFGDVAPANARPKQVAKKRAVKPRATKQARGQHSHAADSASPFPGYGEGEIKPDIKVPRPEAAKGLVMSPSGKRWLSAAEPSQETEQPEIREGSNYQAEVPALLGRRPAGHEKDDPRAGFPGPTTLEALALAASYEKPASDALHIDAVADPEYHPGGVHDVRNLVVERGQRTRRKPRWLANSDGMNRNPARKLLAPGVDEASEEAQGTQGLMTWRSKPAGKRKSEPAPGRDNTKRWRLTQPQGARAASPLAQGDGEVRVLEWHILNDGFMRITVASQDQVFTGALMPQPGAVRPDLAPVEPSRVSEQAQQLDASESASPEWGTSNVPAASSGWNHNPETGNQPSKSNDYNEVESDRHGASRPGTSGPASSGQRKPNHHRRHMANQEYERLQAEGPPKDARCALCRLAADPGARGESRSEEGGPNVDPATLERRQQGLGPMLLVRVSAIMNAWVHVQCALWSPEVYVNRDGGIERASEAVRRGRMIKCKLCGEKGATLGCHKRSCRASFHLPCAREHRCLLQGTGEDQYLVTCREHSEIHNDSELVGQMPPMPDQKKRRVKDRPSNSGKKHRPDGAKQHKGTPNAGGKTGWNLLPKASATLDTLSAAAFASTNTANVDSAANPLAAQHFGGTVGQSLLRPGRCAVCVVQRKGVCGTMTAPKKCLRRIALKAAGRQIPDPPPDWRTRRPVANWPAGPSEGHGGYYDADEAGNGEYEEEVACEGE